MGCDKIRLKEIDALECPLCYEQVDQCDECLDSPIVNEDWWCYSDGDKHYCDSCWQDHLRGLIKTSKSTQASKKRCRLIAVKKH